MKLSIAEILTESASFYKNNFKYLISFSCIYVLIEAFFIAQEITLDILMHQPTSHQLIAMLGSWIIISIGVLILVLIFGPRFLLAIIVQINSVMKNKAMTLEQSYRETKGKYWVTLGCIVLVMLISGLPVLLLALLDLYNIFIGLLITLYVTSINALFFMLLPLIALSKNTEGYIHRAVKLIKGNYIRVFFLYALTTSLLYFVYVTVEIELVEISSRVVVGIFYLLILFFVFPFSQVVMVVVYRKLITENEPEVSQEMIESHSNAEQHDDFEQREVHYDE